MSAIGGKLSGRHGKNAMNRERLGLYLLYGSVFLLPLQTRWILLEFAISGEVWEFGKLSLYAVQVILLLAIVLLGLRRIPSKSGLIFLGFIFIAAAFSLEPLLALGTVFSITLAVFFLATLLDRRVNMFTVAIAFLLGLVFPSLLGWVQVLFGASGSSTILGLAAREAATLGDAVVETKEGIRILRAYGTFPHPNIFGGYIAVGLFILTWVLRSLKVRKQKLLLALPVIVLAATLVITFSRSAWLGATIGFVCLSFLMLWFKKTPPHEAVLHASLGLLAILVTLGTFWTPITSRFQPELRLEQNSVQERQGEYHAFDDVFLQNPLTGIGPGNYTLALARAFPHQSIWSYQPIHNTFLLLLAEVGLLGLFGVLWWTRRILLPIKKTLHSGNAIFAIAMTVALIPPALFDHYLWSSWSGLALTALTGAFVARLVRNP